MIYRACGIPAVLSKGIPGKALRACPGSFRNFSGISSTKSQPYWGYGPLTVCFDEGVVKCKFSSLAENRLKSVKIVQNRLSSAENQLKSAKLVKLNKKRGFRFTENLHVRVVSFDWKKMVCTATVETLLFFCFQGLRPLWCIPFFPDLWCIPLPCFARKMVYTIALLLLCDLRVGRQTEKGGVPRWWCMLLVASYSAIARDYISDTPIARYGVFLERGHRALVIVLSSRQFLRL